MKLNHLTPKLEGCTIYYSCVLVYGACSHPFGFSWLCWALESIVRGNHFYMDGWWSKDGECLRCMGTFVKPGWKLWCSWTGYGYLIIVCLTKLQYLKLATVQFVHGLGLVYKHSVCQWAWVSYQPFCSWINFSSLGPHGLGMGHCRATGLSPTWELCTTIKLVEVFTSWFDLCFEKKRESFSVFPSVF